MVKTVLAIVFAICAGWYFAGALETASKTRARRDDVKRRRLVLGTVGRVAFAAVLLLITLLMIGISKYTVLVSIVGIALSAILVLGNIRLKANGVEAFITCFLTWAAVFLGSIAKNAAFDTQRGGWGKAYMIIQIIAGILIVLGSVIGFLREKGITFREENEEEETVEEDVASSSDEKSEDGESEDDRGNGSRDEEDEDDDRSVPFNWNKFYRIGFWILFIAFVAYFIIFRGLDALFDLYPPYIN